MVFEVIKEAPIVEERKGDDVQVYDESDEESTAEVQGS